MSQSSCYAPPTCKAHPIAILMHGHCAIYASSPTPPSDAILHTILVMAISCKGQRAPCAAPTEQHIRILDDSRGYVGIPTPLTPPPPCKHIRILDDSRGYVGMPAPLTPPFLHTLQGNVPDSCTRHCAHRHAHSRRPRYGRKIVGGM